MKLHTLKIDPEWFQLAHDGIKNYEIRRNDRGYQVGDLLELKETKHSAEEMGAGAPLEYTGRILERKITHILPGLPGDMAILSVEPTLIASAPGAEHEHDISTDTETLITAVCAIAYDLGACFTESTALLEAAARLEEQHQQLSEATELAEHLALENEQLKKDLANSQKRRRYNAERLQTYHAHCSELKNEVARHQQRAEALKESEVIMTNAYGDACQLISELVKAHGQQLSEEHQCRAGRFLEALEWAEAEEAA